MSISKFRTQHTGFVVNENYHKTSSRIQRRVIGENNFTYRNLISFLGNSNIRLKNKKVLDIGCGVGTIALYLSRKGAKVVGIDDSSIAIDIAEESRRTIGLNDIVFKQARFPDQKIEGSFDLVIMSEVLEHLQNDKLALNMVYHNIGNNGRLLISVPSRNAPLYRLGVLKDFDNRVGHKRRYTVDRLNVLCGDAGFEVVMSRKTEGIFRNFMFTNHVAERLVRFIRGPLVKIFSYVDDLSIELFGESQIYILLKKK